MTNPTTYRAILPIREPLVGTGASEMNTHAALLGTLGSGDEARNAGKIARIVIGTSATQERNCLRG